MSDEDWGYLEICNDGFKIGRKLIQFVLMLVICIVVFPAFVLGWFYRMFVPVKKNRKKIESLFEE